MFFKSKITVFLTLAFMLAAMIKNQNNSPTVEALYPLESERVMEIPTVLPAERELVGCCCYVRCNKNASHGYKVEKAE